MKKRYIYRVHIGWALPEYIADFKTKRKALNFIEAQTEPDLYSCYEADPDEEIVTIKWSSGDTFKVGESLVKEYRPYLDKGTMKVVG